MPGVRPRGIDLLRPFRPDLLLVPPRRVPYAVSGCPTPVATSPSERRPCVAAHLAYHVMYRYTDFDRALVHSRAAQFRDQLERWQHGTLSEDAFRPLRLQNGWYVQRHAPMLR